MRFGVNTTGKDTGNKSVPSSSGPSTISSTSLQSALTPDASKKILPQQYSINANTLAPPSEDPERYLRATSKRLVLDTVGQAAWAEKKWLWVEDAEEGFRSAFVVAENGDDVTLEFGDGQRCQLNINKTEKMNPPRFDKTEDMADLSYLNEASVLHNLRQRYFSNLIYTYSGLFLVAVNPYHRFPIYTDTVVQMYKNKKRSEMPPHIFAIADNAYRDMIQNRENQSILITGESGAGKTENTKKVIQYLTAIVCEGKHDPLNSTGLEAQILQANPVLESFGNAQTIRNNNSSRFGKFVRIEFNNGGQITSANIERYLLEKSRVTHQSSKERNYHIFYQLLKGADQALKSKLLLDGGLNDYAFTKHSNKDIEGVDDVTDFKSVIDSMNIMHITEQDQFNFFRAIAAILHLGNITYSSDRQEQAQLTEKAQVTIEKVCHLLGIPVAEFSKGLLKPRIKAGRDIVTQARNPAQVQYSVEALARAIYDRMFSKLVAKINDAIDKPVSKSFFIGVLDIAGFEIFETNSFEQLCINYTNERLQQFFNHHMFILEQDEYKREDIEWKFIDFGLDLQPTIDLIEKNNPIGILSLLDEDCVMPKATDKTFTEKLVGLWKGKSVKFDVPRFGEGFIIQHYASHVEYKTAGWLDKNKDPLNDNITKLLSGSSDPFVADLFSDFSIDEDDTVSRRLVGTVKKGAFRTVGQRHREQLNALMNQLHSTQPHFVRCIIPNEEKKPGRINAYLVLDQLRCNGVLEGIRICRQGFPSRLPFAEFRQRYEILTPGAIPKGFMDGRQACQAMLQQLNFDENQFRIGRSKIFFRAGVLASLEELRDNKLSLILTGFQAFCRGYLARRKFRRREDQEKCIRIIQRNARIYIQLREWAWWKLYSKVKPLLNVSRVDEELRRREEAIGVLQEKLNEITADKDRLDETSRLLQDEKLKLQELLASERNAAADQLNILNRAKSREADLEDELKNLSSAFELIEQQFDDVKALKKNVDDQLKEAKEQLDQEKSLVEKLEKEKALRETQLQTIQGELSTACSQNDKLSADKRALEAEIINLRGQLDESAGKEADLAKNRERLQNTLSDLEEQGSELEKEKKNLLKKIAALEAELRQSKDLLSDTNRAKQELEASLKRKEAENDTLSQKLKDETVAKDGVEKQRREVGLKLEHSERELETLRVEREKINKQKKNLEDELEELHRLIEEKGDLETQQDESRRLREAELVEVRRQLESTAQDIDEMRKKNSAEIDQLRAQIEQLKQEKTALERQKAALEGRVRELTEQLENSEDAKGKLEKARRQLESDMQAVRSKSTDDDKNLSELKTGKELAEKHSSQLQSRIDELESSLDKIQREKSTLQKAVDTLTQDLEDHSRKVANLDALRKKLNSEVADLQTRLEDEENVKLDLNRQLAAKTSELDTVKERLQKDGVERLAEVEKTKVKAEKDLAEAIARSAELDRQLASLEKSKIRMTSEIEDLKLELEKEHSSAKNAERHAKQAEQELRNLVASLETERNQRESLEASLRRSQMTIDSLTLEVEEKQQAFLSVQRTKENLEQELKALVDEIGDGGRNVHELEKSKRRLESRIEELQSIIEEEETARQLAEDAKRKAEEQMTEFRQKIENEMLAKDAQVEETRKVLLKEINALGGQLDEEQSAKNELLKQKKRLESEIEDLLSSNDRDSKNKTDLEKARKKAEASLRDLQSKLDDEKKARKNYEELAARHERKSNSLQSELEKLEGQVESSERMRKSLEKQIAELDEELNGGEGSKAVILDAKKRLEKEVQRLQELLEEAEYARSQLELAQSKAPAVDQSKTVVNSELEGRLEKAEESRRALLAAMRIAEQELEDRKQEIATLDKQKKLLHSEVDDLKQRLENETLAKNEEAAARRKLIAEVKEFSLKLETAVAKAADAEESVNVYKRKYEETIVKLENTELSKLRAEKAEGTLKIQNKELEESLSEALKDRLDAEQRIKLNENELLNLQERVEEDELELNDLRALKIKLHQELGEERERYRRDYDDRENEIENIRRKFQRELKELSEALDYEKRSATTLKDAARSKQLEYDDIVARFEEEKTVSHSLRKDRERLEIKIQELNRSYDEASSGHSSLQTQVSSLMNQVRELRSELDFSESEKMVLERSKRTLELATEELNEKLDQATASKSSVEKTLSLTEQSLREITSNLEEQQDHANVSIEKIRRMEATIVELQSELNKERDHSSEAVRTKVQLERQLKEQQLRIVDLEAAITGDPSRNAKRLDAKIIELSDTIDRLSRERDDSAQNARRNDRLVRDLTQQLTDKEKLRQRQEDELIKLTDRFRKTKQELIDLESSESSAVLAKKRAERELEEVKDKSSRLEKEVEKLKLRLDRVAAV